MSGTKRVRPLATASRPALAKPSIFTYHWSESMGSTTASERCERGCISLCGFTLSTRPAFSRSARTRFLASNRSRPRYAAGALSFTFASSVKMSTIGSAWRAPIW